MWLPNEVTLNNKKGYTYKQMTLLYQKKKKINSLLGTIGLISNEHFSYHTKHFGKIQVAY